MTQKTIVVLGLDGLDWELIEVLLERNVLPTLEFVLKKSIVGTIWGYPPHTAPIWVSMRTGVKPRKHGIFDFFKPYSGKLVTPYDICYPRIWDMLAVHGLRSAVIGVFLEEPSMVSPKYTHIIADRLLVSKPLFNSADFMYKLISHGYIPQIFTIIHNKYLVKKLWIKTTAALCDLVYYFRNNYTLLWIELNIPDMLLHMFPNYVYKAKYFDKLFLGIDKFVRKLKDVYDVLIIVSDHGFKAIKAYNIMLILYRLGLLNLAVNENYRSKISTNIMELLFNKGNRKILSLIWLALKNGTLRRSIRKTLKIIGTDLPLKPDTKTSIIYPPIRIYSRPNVSRRLVVNNTEAAEILVTKLGKVFSKLEGFRGIIEAEKFFEISKPYRANNMIEYIVLLSSGYGLEDRIYSGFFTKIYDHDPGGVFIMFNGEERREDVGIIHPEDIVPTILAYLKLPIPADTDGKILGSVMKESVELPRLNYLAKWKIVRRIAKVRSNIAARKLDSTI